MYNDDLYIVSIVCANANFPHSCSIHYLYESWSGKVVGTTMIFMLCYNLETILLQYLCFLW